MYDFEKDPDPIFQSTARKLDMFDYTMIGGCVVGISLILLGLFL